MQKFLGKWLNVYKGEIGLLLFCAALSFLIRSSSILFTNFAETAFLKRYGVEFLPVVMAVNSISTFVIMSFMTGIMARVPGTRLLAYLFLFCGASAAALRFTIPLGIDLLYPFLYILKAQYEGLLALVFWNMANDLFNTRQSKRLFPLVTAGGVIGMIIGSFATPALAKTISLDNLLFVYLGISLVGAVVVTKVGARFPTLLLAEKKDVKKGSRPPVLEQFKRVLPVIKESKLIKILILVTLIPNVVLQIMNYQFNFAIDQHYATEGGMLQFFGYFRGYLNIINLVILLFIGKIYARWGLPIALLFHPVNYMIAFLAFLFRFELVTAMYARISTKVLLTTIHNPAKAVLMGLVPPSARGVLRPFLRGTVVRVGQLLGAGLIMVAEPFVHPRYFSLIGVLFVGAWIITAVALKREYSGILFDLISRNMLDLRAMEDIDVGLVFADKKVKSALTGAFLSARGDDCLWYARLEKSIGAEDLDANILAVLKEQSDDTKIGLLSLLSPNAGDKAVPLLRELAGGSNPDLSIAAIQAMHRVQPGDPSGYDLEVFESSRDPVVKAYALVGLYTRSPRKYRDQLDAWLASDDVTERTAGVIAAGESGDRDFETRLKGMLTDRQDVSVVPFLLKGLGNLHLLKLDMNALARSYLSHPEESVRVSALETFAIEDDEDLQTVIPLLGDPSDRIHELAIDKLQNASYHNAELLVEALVLPSAKVREGVFFLLEFLEVKDVDVFRFARFQLERGYRNLAESQALHSLPESQARDLLIAHLDHKKGVRLENLLRGLATQDRSGRTRIIWRGLSSTNPRERSNSLEALESSAHPSLSKLMVPLLEDLPPSQCLAVGRKNFQLPAFDSDTNALISYFLSKTDWVTVVLTLYLVAKQSYDSVDRTTLEQLARSENRHVRQLALILVNGQEAPREKEDQLADAITVPEKILHLKRIHIFENLSVTELAAIASVTEEAVYPPGEIVIREGEQGDTMYLVLKGDVSVLKSREGEQEGHEMELDHIRTGDYFGEMALFEDTLRSATIRTAEETSLLVLHKRELTEIVREHPQIALNICKVLGGRLRILHEKLKECE
jgi:hypothetical protein